MSFLLERPASNRRPLSFLDVPGPMDDRRQGDICSSGQTIGNGLANAGAWSTIEMGSVGDCGLLLLTTIG